MKKRHPVIHSVSSYFAYLISPIQAIPISLILISLNLFILIGGPTTTTYFVVFFLASCDKLIEALRIHSRAKLAYRFQLKQIWAEQWTFNPNIYLNTFKASTKYWEIISYL